MSLRMIIGKVNQRHNKTFVQNTVLLFENICTIIGLQHFMGTIELFCKGDSVMRELTLRRNLVRRTKELAAWQMGAIGLLVLASLFSSIIIAALMTAHDKLDRQADQLQQMEYTRDLALQEMKRLSFQAERVEGEQTDNHAAGSDYMYIGECIITSYCPCEICCGSCADGLTATGVPAEPGGVAVDPDIIPLGSTVILNDQEYMAADAGVKGLAIHICAAEHQEALAYGVQRQDVWVIAP